jgi:ABC-2 type transport system permease protein
MTLLSGTQVSFGAGAVRLLAAVAYLGLCLASLGAVGLFVSTLTEQPIGATIAVLVFELMCQVLDQIPQLDWLHPWLLTHWWMSFGDLFRDPIAWHGLVRGLLTAAGYAVVAWLAAWARFTSKDVTS